MITAIQSVLDTVGPKEGHQNLLEISRQQFAKDLLWRPNLIWSNIRKNRLVTVVKQNKKPKVAQ